MKQPDFQKLFYEHFGGVPRKVTYSIRQDSNGGHDLIFLESLIHDARFKMSDVVLHGKRLKITVNRDCWELGMVEHKDSTELYVANSKLTICQVCSIEWRIPHGMKMEETELWIRSMSLTPPTHDNKRNMMINGHGWSCVVMLNDDDVTIRLADQETPHLYSE